MTRYRDETSIEQLLFGFTDRLDVTAWSRGLPDHAVHLWSNRLSVYNRLSPTSIESEFWTPDEAFSYFEFSDGQAALLARFSHTDNGRNKSHALVGPTPVLAPFAMSLSEWQGWHRRQGDLPLQPVDQRDWHQLRTRWLDDAQASVESNRLPLTNLVRAVLAEEATHFTVLNHPDPLPMLTLVQDILDPILSPSGGEFRWTYSTYEHSDTTAESSPRTVESPRFWCVRVRPESGESERCRVDVDQRPPDDHSTALAIDLVQQYIAAPSQFAIETRSRLKQFRDRRARIGALLGSPKPTRVVHAPVMAPTQRFGKDELVQERPSPPVATGPVAPLAPPPAPYVLTNRSRASRRKRPWAASPRTLVIDNQQTDAHGLLDQLAKGDLTLEARRKNVEDLRRLWDDEDGYYGNSGRSLRRFEARLNLYGLALGVAIFISVLTALVTWIAWPTPVIVPATSLVTVTVGPPPGVPPINGGGR
jgi:hypothetical protein